MLSEALVQDGSSDDSSQPDTQAQKQVELLSRRMPEVDAALQDSISLAGLFWTCHRCSVFMTSP